MAEEKKSLFQRFVYDPDANSRTPQNVPHVGTRPPGVPAQTTVPPVPRTQRLGAVGRPATFDQEFFEIILGRIGSDVAIPKGFDQLIQMLLSMEETMASTPLQQRFEIALKTVGALTGITREQTVQTLRKQQEVVEKLKAEFEKSMTADAEDQKATHNGDMQNLQGHIEQLKQQIADLKRQQASDERRLTEIKDSLKGVDAQLENDRAAFIATCSVIQQGAPQRNWIGIDVLLLDVITPATSSTGGTRG